MKEKYIIFCFLHKIFKIFIYYPLHAIKIIILKIFAFLQIEILAYNFVENFLIYALKILKKICLQFKIFSLIKFV